MGGSVKRAAGALPSALRCHKRELQTNVEFFGGKTVCVATKQGSRPKFESRQSVFDNRLADHWIGGVVAAEFVNKSPLLGRTR